MTDEKQEHEVMAKITLWQELGPEETAPCIFRTQDGKRIGISVGGSAHVMPLKDWHNLAVINSHQKSESEGRNTEKTFFPAWHLCTQEKPKVSCDLIFYRDHEDFKKKISFGNSVQWEDIAEPETLYWAYREGVDASDERRIASPFEFDALKKQIDETKPMGTHENPIL